MTNNCPFCGGDSETHDPMCGLGKRDVYVTLSESQKAKAREAWHWGGGESDYNTPWLTVYAVYAAGLRDRTTYVAPHPPVTQQVLRASSLDPVTRAQARAERRTSNNDAGRTPIAGQTNNSPKTDPASPAPDAEVAGLQADLRATVAQLGPVKATLPMIRAHDMIDRLTAEIAELRKPPADAEVAGLLDRLRAWQELAEFADGGWGLPPAATEALNKITGKAADLIDRLTATLAERTAELDALNRQGAAAGLAWLNERNRLVAALAERDLDRLRLDALEMCIRDGSYQSIIHDIAATCQHAYKTFGKGPAIRTAIDGALDDCLAALRAKDSTT